MGNKIGIAILVFGGLYLWARQAEADPESDPDPGPGPDPDPDPGPGPDPETPVFSFSNVQLSVQTCPVATAWKTPTFTCSVVNNGVDPATHVLNMRYRRYKVSAGEWYGPFEEQEGLIELTLDPGESYQYTFEGYHEQWNDPGDWECDPQMGSTYDWEFWLEDELGNRSGIATART